MTTSEAPAAEEPTPVAPAEPRPEIVTPCVASTGSPTDGSLERAKLAGETARHYGNMRFTMFTVFTTIAGAFLAFPFTAAGSAFITVWHQKLLTCAAGVAISVLFGLSEYRISTLVTFYQEKAYGAASIVEPPKHKVWHVVVMVTMLMPAVITGVFWVLLSAGYIAVQRG
jgi:hypothetical protein